MLRWARTTHVAQERVKDLRIAHAHNGRLVRIEPKKAHEPNRFGRGGFARRPMPFDLREVRPDDGDLVRGGEIQKRWPGEEPGIQPQRAIGHEEIETGPAQKIATHGAASSAARGEHERNNDRGSYKSWAMSGDGPNLLRGDSPDRKADIFIQRETVSRNGSDRGRPYATGPTRGRRRHVASDLAD